MQPAKAALAGTLAWVLAARVLGLQQPFLAPWSAVLVVHATVYRTVSRGAQQVAATFVGVLLAWSAGQLLGLGAAAMALMLAAWPSRSAGCAWWREEATTIATTGIAVLATNAVAHTNLLAGRLVDTAVGVVVGLAVNLLVWPPLRDRAAWSRIDELPTGPGRGARRTSPRDCSPDLEPEEAEEWTRAAAGGRRSASTRPGGWCARRRRAAGSTPGAAGPPGWRTWTTCCTASSRRWPTCMSMMRTSRSAPRTTPPWDAGFRSDWSRLVTATAEAVRERDEETLQDAAARARAARLDGSPTTRSPARRGTSTAACWSTCATSSTRSAEVTSWANRSGPSTRRQRRYDVPVTPFVARARRVPPRHDP